MKATGETEVSKSGKQLMIMPSGVFEQAAEHDQLTPLGRRRRLFSSNVSALAAIPEVLRVRYLASRGAAEELALLINNAASVTKAITVVATGPPNNVANACTRAKCCEGVETVHLMAGALGARGNTPRVAPGHQTVGAQRGTDGEILTHLPGSGSANASSEGHSLTSGTPGAKWGGKGGVGGLHDAARLRDDDDEPAAKVNEAVRAEENREDDVVEATSLEEIVDPCHAPPHGPPAAHDGTAEWNVYWDPAATSELLTRFADCPRSSISGEPRVRLYPLDVTNAVPVTEELVVRLALPTSRARHAAASWALTAGWTTADPKDGYFAWDVVTVAGALWPDLFPEWRETCVRVEMNVPSRGRTVETPCATNPCVCPKKDGTLVAVPVIRNESDFAKNFEEALVRLLGEDV